MFGKKQFTASLHGFEMEIVAVFPPIENSVNVIATLSKLIESPTEFRVAVSIVGSLSGEPSTRITPSPEDRAVFSK